jgi:hypothetical protein
MDLLDAIPSQRLGDGAAYPIDRRHGLTGFVQSPQQTNVKLIRPAELTAAQDVQ